MLSTHTLKTLTHQSSPVVQPSAQEERADWWNIKIPKKPSDPRRTVLITPTPLVSPSTPNTARFGSSIFRFEMNTHVYIFWNIHRNTQVSIIYRVFFNCPRSASLPKKGRQGRTNPTTLRRLSAGGLAGYQLLCPWWINEAQPCRRRRLTTMWPERCRPNSHSFRHTVQPSWQSYCPPVVEHCGLGRNRSLDSVGRWLRVQ